MTPLSYHAKDEKATKRKLFPGIQICDPRHTSVVLNQKEENEMNCHANKCIECTVKSCAYHCDTENYCSLERILVGTHEAHPAEDQCTDCKSFRKK